MVVRPFDDKILDMIDSTTRLGDEIAEPGTPFFLHCAKL